MFCIKYEYKDNIPQYKPSKQCSTVALPRQILKVLALKSSLHFAFHLLLWFLQPCKALLCLAKLISLLMAACSRPKNVTNVESSDVLLDMLLDSADVLLHSGAFRYTFTTYMYVYVYVVHVLQYKNYMYLEENNLAFWKFQYAPRETIKL